MRNDNPLPPQYTYSNLPRKTPGSPDTQPAMPYHAREFINSLLSVLQISPLTPYIAGSSNNTIALLSWRRPTRRFVGLLTTHLRVIRALRLLELNTALLSAIVIRIPSILLLILLLRGAVRRRWGRSAVVVPALLSLIAVVLVMLLVDTVLSSKPACAVAWRETLTTATARIDASESVS